MSWVASAERAGKAEQLECSSQFAASSTQFAAYNSCQAWLWGLRRSRLASRPVPLTEGPPCIH